MNLKKWLTVIITMLILFSSPNILTAEGAGNRVELTTSVPLKGVYKNNSLVSVYVHAKNGGSAFSGELVLSRKDMNITVPISYGQELNLTANEEKDVVIEVNSDSLMGDRLIGVSLYQGGKEMSWTSIQPLSVHHEWIAGVLSSEESAFHFLSLVQPEDHRGLIVKSLDPKDIPNDSVILENLDVLAMGHLPSDLSPDQANAIKSWVAEGGTLIVSGGKAYEGTLNVFGSWLPYSSAKTVAQSTKELQELSETQPPLSLVDSLQQSEQPFYRVQKGKGSILVVAYDVTREPMASWQGNKQLWTNIIREQLFSTMQKKESGLRVDHELIELSYMSPGVQPPHLPTLTILWGIYILVISPLLYFFLKRRDKREWAWVVIPSFSLLFTAGVYWGGGYSVAKENSSHTVSKVQILSGDSAKVNTATSFLVIQGGNYQIEKTSNSKVIPHQFSYRENVNEVLIRENGNIEFLRVPYLTMKPAYTKGMAQDLGAMEGNMMTEENRIYGTVKNNTVFDLKKVKILMGLQEISIGDLAKGEEVKIDKTLKRVYSRQNDPIHNPKITLEERLKRSLTQIPYQDSPITIVGLSEQGESVFDLVGKKEKKYFSTMVSQGLALTPGSNGKQIFPYGTLPIRTGEVKGNWDYNQYEYYLERGFLNFALTVKPNGFQPERIQIPLNEAPYQTFEKSIYHVKEDRWEKIPQGEALTLTGEKMDDYVTHHGELILRFENPTDVRFTLPAPQFLVEGEVAKKHD